MKMNLPENISTRQFLQHYWQKKPLLIRNALPGFEGLMEPDDLMQLACRDDTESRLVIRKNQAWQVRYGPFTTKDFSRLPKKKWTLLVQDVNHFLPSARELLLRFNFIPYARLDDVMVSYAPQGGGVGPHFDSYDVFLLQGKGQRCWQIAAGTNQQLVENTPLKILRHFQPEQEWILNPGDMLYLPPGYAHNGTAVNECMTYSIGFRAPSYQELTTQFLVYLQDHVHTSGIYHDPDLVLQTHPARISSAMLHQVGQVVGKITWEKSDIRDFMGTYLTEPKPHVFFSPPDRPLTYKRFLLHAFRYGLETDLKSRMLCSEGRVFLNGEIHTVAPSAYRSLEKLANTQKVIAGESLTEEVMSLLYEWYCCGFIRILK